MILKSTRNFYIKEIACFFLLFFFVSINIAQAGFGITPPYVRNTSLIRNSTYEQQILLVRGNPDTNQKAEVIVDAPEIASWIEIVEGVPLALPRGEQKVPMTVRVTVPKDAEFKTYEGAIRVRTLPDDNEVASGAVSISLGAKVDISLTVIDKELLDFRIRKIGVSDLNEGKKLGWLYFPGKVNFTMSLENTGNVPVAPSKVEFRIFSYDGRQLLEETVNKNRIRKVDPYDTEEVVAEIPTRLPAGSYVARYKIFNGDDVKQEGEVNLSILPRDTLQQAGFGFNGLSLPHKVSVLLPVFTLTIFVLYLIYNRRNARRRA